MSVVVQKLRVRLTKKHGMLIIRQFQKGSKAGNLQFIDSFCQHSKHAELKRLPLPLNVRDLPHSERMIFSKERGRDILGMYLAAFSSPNDQKDNDCNRYESDSRIEKYICSGSVDLSSSMQTNVPEPFSAKIRPVHLNMPRGQWRQEAKYISEQLQNFHYSNTRLPTSLHHSKRFFSMEKKFSESNETTKSAIDELSNQGKEMTKSQKLKSAIKEYGITIFVLHITISLVSLAICYLIVQSGFDMEEIIKKYGWSDAAGVIASAGPFIVAYTVHKVFAPFRIGLTLTITPFLVQFLRKRGFRIKGK